MTTHSRLSPSKRHRWSVCPGSVREEARYPDTSSASAADGTLTHELLNICLTQGVRAESFVGLPLMEGGPVIDVDRARRVNVALDYVERRRNELGDADIASEVRVDPRELVWRDDLSGTADIVITSPGVLEIVDYKDGVGVVEVERNLQLDQYALGAVGACTLIAELPKTVRFTIIQPKLSLFGKESVSWWDIQIGELMSGVMKLNDEAAATDNPDAPLVPGDSQCRFCKHKGSCSALASSVMKDVGVMFEPIVTQSLDVAEQSAEKDPHTMSDDQLAQIMGAAPLLRQLLEKVEEEVIRRMKAGKSIAGLKLVNGRGSRAWSLPEEQMADKLVKMGIPKGSVYETKLVSPSKAEKLQWTKRDGTTVQLSERQLKRLKEEYTTKFAGKLTVVPESDSRPAVITNAAPLFGAVQAAPVAESLPSWLS